MIITYTQLRGYITTTTTSSSSSYPFARCPIGPRIRLLMFNCDRRQIESALTYFCYMVYVSVFVCLQLDKNERIVIDPTYSALLWRSFSPQTLGNFSTSLHTFTVHLQTPPQRPHLIYTCIRLLFHWHLLLSRACVLHFFCSS